MNGGFDGGKQDFSRLFQKRAFVRGKLQKRGAALSRQILNDRGPLSLPPPKGPDGGVFARRGRVDQNALELYTQTRLNREAFIGTVGGHDPPLLVLGVLAG